MATHVREFIKPRTVMLKHRLQTNPLKPMEFEDVQVPFRYDDFAAQFLWTFSKWNTEEGWDEAQIRIGQVIEEAAEGEPIKFELLGDFEKFHEANKAAKIDGPNAWRIRKMQKAGKEARPPEKVVNGAEVGAAVAEALKG